MLVVEVVVVKVVLVVDVVLVLVVVVEELVVEELGPQQHVPASFSGCPSLQYLFPPFSQFSPFAVQSPGVCLHSPES